MSGSRDTDLYHDWEGDNIQPAFNLVFGIIATILFFLQVIFLRKLTILPVYVLPVLSCCLAFVNIGFYDGENIQMKSPLADALHFFHALIVPLFVLVLFEMTFRLHEARSAKFCFIPFDQQSDVINEWGLSIKLITRIPLWCIRIVVTGLFVINILVDYRFITCDNSDHYVGKGGYLTLAEHPSMVPLWLSLIPSMFLSSFGLYIGIVLYKYGVNFTISIAFNRRWRIIGVCILLFTVGHIFSTSCFTTTSNAAEILLLMSLSYILYLIQKDLALAGSFADFLHRSNLAFDFVKARQIQIGEVDGEKRRNDSGVETRGTEMVGSV